jgi:hypothetical protein
MDGVEDLRAGCVAVWSNWRSLRHTSFRRFRGHIDRISVKRQGGNYFEVMSRAVVDHVDDDALRLLPGSKLA